jgi:hypothetical protein
MTKQHHRRRHHPARCRTTGKTSFRDRLDAMLALARIQAATAEDRDYLPQRAYRCNECGAWHLTKKPLRTRQPA